MQASAIEGFFATLKAANPTPVTELEYSSVFELLCSVLLSAQATDLSVNKATRRLFPRANTPQAMLDLGLAGLAQSKHGKGCVGDWKKPTRRLVDADVGGLG